MGVVDVVVHVVGVVVAAAAAAVIFAVDVRGGCFDCGGRNRGRITGTH